ncbi:hypothetical protein BN133_4153 [Cronobacter dublinensis 582]|nr:hypothetical protein BN133_4153 [Cronobacter dublinensis 582]
MTVHFPCCAPEISGTPYACFSCHQASLPAACSATVQPPVNFDKYHEFKERMII